MIEEGRLLARVRHPNVVTVYGADRVDGRVGLWMEFVHGRTLEAVLHEHGRFSAKEAALIGLDLLHALSAVHSAGLLHRDVKAQNVMREAGGRIVLMDFGAGREIPTAGSAEVAGTPLYLAPEVFAIGTPTARSDIYSVGVLLFHLVTGEYPVRGATVSAIREAHAEKRRVWLRDVRPDLARPFVEVVERALAFDPDERYASAGAMERALMTVVASTPPVIEAGPEPHVAAPAPARRRTSLAWQMSIVAATVAIATAALFMPAAWRERVIGSGGGGPANPSEAAAIAKHASPALRQIRLPDYSVVGAPSADDRLFSFADTSGNVAVIDLATAQVTPVTRDAVFGRNSQVRNPVGPVPRRTTGCVFVVRARWQVRIARHRHRWSTAPRPDAT